MNNTYEKEILKRFSFSGIDESSKINKIIAKNTIDNFNLKNNKAFNFIFNHNNLKKGITVEDLGFLIAHSEAFLGLELSPIL